MVAVPIADSAQMRRLVEVAADVAHLADERSTSICADSSTTYTYAT